jgi:hypothetical protein
MLAYGALYRHVSETTVSAGEGMSSHEEQLKDNDRDPERVVIHRTFDAVEILPL